MKQIEIVQTKKEEALKNREARFIKTQIFNSNKAIGQYANRGDELSRIHWEKAKKLWEDKSSTVRKCRGWCKHCSDSGCDDPDAHERTLMQMAYELGKQS